MAKKMVIDSSVAAKWFLKDEVDTDLADDLLLSLLAGEIEGAPSSRGVLRSLPPAYKSMSDSVAT